VDAILRGPNAWALLGCVSMRMIVIMIVAAMVVMIAMIIMIGMVFMVVMVVMIIVVVAAQFSGVLSVYVVIDPVIE
jgi:hypothetical protein